MHAPVMISRDPVAPVDDTSTPPVSPTGWKALLLFGLRRGWTVVRIAGGWVPLTLLGLAATPLLIWLFESWGRGRHDFILLALAGAGLVVQAGATLLVVVTALWLRIRLRDRGLGSLEMEAGKA